MAASTTQHGSRLRAEHDPRAAALLIIDTVLAGKEASQNILDATLRDSRLVPLDKRLCTELVYGYLRNRICVSWHLEQLLAHPEKLPAEMQLTLGLAAYELAYLSRIPAHASVNWAVSRVRNRFGQGLAKVANGVLRSFSRNVPGLFDDARYASLPEADARLAVRFALPVWIFRLWREAYGDEVALCYAKASSAQAVSALRVNAARERAASLRAQLVNDCKGVPVGAWGVAFPEGAPYAARSLEREGAVSFQSPGVQEVMAFLDATSWKGSVWDACAGRGGKTAALLELGVNVAAATDASAARIGLLPGELARLGLDATGLAVKEADAASVDAVTSSFDVVLADVPCSGLGTLSRRPEIRFRRTEADCDALCATQDAILDAAAAHTASGGSIAYLTCTLNPRENEQRIAAFLARHASFFLEREWRTPDDSPWNEFFYAAVVRHTGA